MALVFMLNGSVVKVLDQTAGGSPLSGDDTIDGRSTCTFTILDNTGTLQIEPGTPVQITDTTLNQVIFDGYVNEDDQTNLTPNTAIEHVLTCNDRHYGADKRYYAGPEWQETYSGDIATDILTNTLAAEGITAAYAVDHADSFNAWQQGTLSGVTASNNISGGDLELAAAGTDFIQTIAATSIASFSAIKFVGTAIQAVNGTNYEIHNIYVPASSTTVLSGDYLQYDVWIQSDSPAIIAGLDIVFTDGSTFGASTGAGTDSQGMSASPATDLSGYANDQWFTRSMGVASPLIGKTIAYFTISFLGTKTGTYTAYIRRAIWANLSTGTYFTMFGDTSTSLQNNSIVGTNGYTNTALSVVQAHDKTYNTSYTYSLNSVGIVKNSNLTWDISGFTVPSDASFILQSSIDAGASRQVVTNGSAVPNLLAGFRTSGQSLYLWLYAVQGKDPTGVVTMPDLVASVYSAPANSNGGSDVIAVYDTPSEWTSGTFNNTANLITTPSALYLQGIWNPFAQVSDYTSGKVTNFGGGGLLTMQRSTLINTISASAETHAQFNFAGTWQNFVAEMDIQILSNMFVGFIYRTTAWSSNPGSPAYFISLGTGGIQLYRGQNNTAGGSSTLVASAGVSLTSGTYYHLQVAVHGAAHNIYINNVLVLSVSDTTYSGSGYIGVYSSNGDTVSHSYGMRNFGVTARIIGGSDTIMQGTWTSPVIPLSSANTYGNSIIAWDATTVFNNTTLLADGLTYNPPGSSILVQTSLNGGTTWTTATNGAAIPGLTAGQSLSGVNLQVLVTLTTTDASYQPQIGGLSIWLTSQYLASGSRVSPALSLANVDRAGSTAVTLAGVLPSNATNIYVDTSLDDVTFTNVLSGVASGGANIAGINTQPPVVVDLFTANTSNNYIQSYGTGGSLSSWTWDTANTRLIATGGGYGLLLDASATTRSDVDISTITDHADDGGLAWRYQDSSNFYALGISDASASSTPNTIRVYSVVSGTRTQIGNVNISFTRGTPHTLRLNMQGSTINVYFDGVNVLSLMNGALSAAGFCGFRNNGGTAQYYIFRLQMYGDVVSALEVFSRIRLTSTDPANSPQVTGLIVSCHSPNIENGALIDQTAYSMLNGNDKTCANIFDDIAKQSGNFWWRIIQGQFYFRSQQSTLAPWVVTSNDVLVKNLEIDHLTPVYRNSQWIKGATDSIPFPQTFVGDGKSTSFACAFPVDYVSSIVLNPGNIVQTVGIKGADTGKQWYYKQGDVTIYQDSSGTPLSDIQTIDIDFNGIVPITVNVKRPAEITRMSGIDQTSGIIEHSDDGRGLTKAAAITKADGLLSTNAVDSKTAKFDTLRPGLAVGQLVCIFLAPFGIFAGSFLITDIKWTYLSTVQNGVSVLQPWYSITAISGPNVGDWTRFIADLSK